MIGRPSPCSTGSSARSAVFTASASTPSLPASITNAMARHSRSNSGGGDCGDGGRTARGQRGSGIDRCQKWPAPRGEGGGGGGERGARRRGDAPPESPPRGRRPRPREGPPSSSARVADAAPASMWRARRRHAGSFRQRKGETRRAEGATPDCRLKARYVFQFFTHRSVSTFDRSPFQLTGELFLYRTHLTQKVRPQGVV